MTGHGGENSTTGWCTRNLWVSGGAQLMAGTLAFHVLTPTPCFILIWAFHDMHVCWDRQEVSRGQDTNIHLLGPHQQ